MDGAHEFLVSAPPVALLQVSLCKLIVRLREFRIELNGVLKFDGSFLVFSLLEVSLAAIEVLLLENVGIAGTTCDDGGHNQQGDPK